MRNMPNNNETFRDYLQRRQGERGRRAQEFFAVLFYCACSLVAILAAFLQVEV